MNQSLYFEGASSIEFKKLGNIGSAQDGAAFGGYLFHLDVPGTCQVYSTKDLSLVSSFTLGSADLIVPHSNAVFFGSEFYDEGDEFPLLYSNIYNNYSEAADQLEGVCCVYRIARQEQSFSADLVQLIRIGFTDDPLWRSENVRDVRPYGNFVADNDRRLLHAFVMRDEDHGTRFFTFRLPKKNEGDMCEKYGVKVATLRKEDILSSFDEEYVNYMQGAICSGEYIYSVEGFTVPSGVLPAFRVFDVNTRKMVFHTELAPLGLPHEPEFVEVYENKVLYADATGDLYEARFKA